jgi:hypothetical protein
LAEELAKLKEKQVKDRERQREELEALMLEEHRRAL